MNPGGYEPGAGIPHGLKPEGPGSVDINPDLPGAPGTTPGMNPDPYPALPSLPGHGGSRPASGGVPERSPPDHRPTGDPLVPGLGLPKPMD